MIDASVVPPRAPARGVPSGPSARRLGVLVVLAAVLPFAAGPARAAPPSAPAPGAPRGSAPGGTVQQRAPDPAPARATSGPEADVGTRSVAARARMSECGHQWNNMKRTGAATGTWKEFSRSCLAQK